MNSFLLIIVIIICVIIGYYFGKNKKIVQEHIDNEPLRQEKQKLESEICFLNEQEQQVINQINKAEDEYSKQKNLLNETINNLTKNIDLEVEKYQNTADEKIDMINQEIENINNEKDKIKNELESLKATRKAAIEASKKEIELEKNPEDFCIPFSAQELHDIKLLNDFRSQLNYPIALGKVIWSVFIQKKMNNFCATRLQTSDKVCGIYKITNILTKECYIGESVNIKDRFSEHIKAGVGATESSVTNKLYQAMQKYGIQNFAFELVEPCSSAELNAKEKYFISLYQSDVNGYNIVRGIGK